MRFFYKHYPRQIALPARYTIDFEEEFYRYINKINKIKPKVFGSLYNCDNEGKFENVLIDKIGFDIDYKGEKSINEMFGKLLNINNILLNLNYQHMFQFSTAGFWLFVFSKNYENIKNSKSALKNCQLDIAKMCNLSIGEPEKADIDFHVIGDTARICRIFNTFDTKRQMYAIPITIEDIKQGYDFIKEKAKKQCFEFVLYGDDQINLKEYDYISQEYIVDIPENTKEDYSLASGTFIENFPPCVKRALLEEYHWKGGFLISTYLKDVEGMPLRLTQKLAKEYLSKKCKPKHEHWINDFNHFTKHDHFPDFVYKRDLMFPKCSSVYFADWNKDGENNRIFCKGKCKFFNSFYKGDKKEEALEEENVNFG